MSANKKQKIKKYVDGLKDYPVKMILEDILKRLNRLEELTGK